VSKKLGPLPTWAWIVLMGGTVGIVLFLRKKSSTTTSESELIDPATGVPWATEYATEQTAATQAANESAGAGGGSTAGSSAGESAETAALKEITTMDRESNEAVMAGLTAIPGEVQAIQAQGVTERTPAQTFTGEVNDISGAVGALLTLGSMFNPAASGASGGGTKPAAKAPAPAVKRYLNKASGKMETAVQIKAYKAPKKK
jgi:hypothetical protein